MKGDGPDHIPLRPLLFTISSLFLHAAFRADWVFSRILSGIPTGPRRKVRAFDKICPDIAGYPRLFLGQSSKEGPVWTKKAAPTASRR